MDELHLAARYTEIILEQLSQGQKPHAILDIGCGLGIITNFLKGSFPDAQLVGIDIDAEAIFHAKELYPACSFKVGDVLQIPYSDNSFDCVMLIQVLHHVPAPLWPQAIQEIFRILKPGGKLILLENNPFNYWARKEFLNAHTAKKGFIIKPFLIASLLKNYNPVIFYYSTHREGLVSILLRWLHLSNIYMAVGTKL